VLISISGDASLPRCDYQRDHHLLRHSIPLKINNPPMETPVQKSYSTHNIVLAVFLFAFFWLTGNSIEAEQSPPAYLGGVIGATVTPFMLSAIILLVLRIFGVRWNGRTFFYLALAFAVFVLIGRLSGNV